MVLTIEPRALPWAIVCRPFGAPVNPSGNAVGPTFAWTNTHDSVSTVPVTPTASTTVARTTRSDVPSSQRTSMRSTSSS